MEFYKIYTADYHQATSNIRKQNDTNINNQVLINRWYVVIYVTLNQQFFFLIELCCINKV